ncbi:MAG TPA: diacylglycerol kinase family protein [Thermoleophilaceae bacterium]
MKRLAALTALLLFAGTLALAVVVAAQSFPRGISVLACLVVAVVAAWWGLVRRGVARVLGFGVALILFAGAIVFVARQGSLVGNLIVLAAFLLALGVARVAFAQHLTLTEVSRPQHPVLFYNPKSGGGKAERFKVADEARARGIEPIELTLGDDLFELVEAAVARGADGLAMAGGDGSQAIVAAVAAKHGLPYACIPAGTRNHFALDLGVDRDDVVGALDAFVDGGERVVDLAEVNGRVFVNNVSLGVYAEAVQQEGYRNAKLRTLADTAPTVLGPNAQGLDLRWTDPDGGESHSNAVILVSNDAYRLGVGMGAGTRPRLDEGVLGIAVMGAAGDGGHEIRRMREWSSKEFEISSDSPVAAGIDGESARLDPPLRFRSRPAALRVRIAPQHPGASPSAGVPATLWGSVLGLVSIAAGATGKAATRA